MRSRDELALLEREDPVRAEELPAAGSAEARALKERIMLAEVEPVPPPARRSRRPLLAVVGALVALTAIATLPRVLPDEHLGASPAAAAVLERAAAAANADEAGAGRYAYTRARTLYMVTAADPPSFSALVPRVRETWVAADGSGRIVESTEEPTFVGPRDRARWLAAGSPPLAATGVRVEEVRGPRPVPDDLLAADPEELSLEQLDQLVTAVPRLPTDTDRLERIIRAYAEHKDAPHEAAIFNQISGLLHSPYASPDLRAALYRVLARVEGVELGGRRIDSEGREATVITAPAGYGGPNEATVDPADSTLNESQVRHLLIDPATGSVLGEETVLTERVEWVDGEPGDVIGAIVILEHGRVDSLEERPRPR